mgnify:CR=1 FL=1
MDITTAAAGTRFFTTYASMNYSKPTASITQWELVCPEHRVAVLVGYKGETIPAHTNVIDSKEQVFDNESAAWKNVAEKLQAIVNTINTEISECMKKAEPLAEAA